MQLGQFSVSLTVKDLKASLSFYEILGFEVIEGGHTNKGFPDSEKSKWRILKSGDTVIGLFQGMFPDNILTFNPTNVRGIQKHLKSKNIALVKEADPNTEGPESIVLMDPDGNQLLIDQH
ncbi:MAG: VOC family protein [Aureibaculum sp.]|nr:VOC family protein [Aureibaculum sp.]